MQRVGGYATRDLTEIIMGYEATRGAPSVILVDRVGQPLAPNGSGDGGLDRVLLMVDDLRGTCKRLVDSGGQIVREPTEIAEHGVTIAIVLDLDGHPLELIEM